jgi:hypothetical protein
MKTGQSHEQLLSKQAGYLWMLVMENGLEKGKNTKNNLVFFQRISYYLAETGID